MPNGEWVSMDLPSLLGTCLSCVAEMWTCILLTNFCSRRICCVSCLKRHQHQSVHGRVVLLICKRGSREQSFTAPILLCLTFRPSLVPLLGKSTILVDEESTQDHPQTLNQPDADQGDDLSSDVMVLMWGQWRGRGWGWWAGGLRMGGVVDAAAGLALHAQRCQKGSFLHC